MVPWNNISVCLSPNGISICSAVFAQLTGVSNTQTTLRDICRLAKGPHLCIVCSRCSIILVSLTDKVVIDVWDFDTCIYVRSNCSKADEAPDLLLGSCNCKLTRWMSDHNAACHEVMRENNHHWSNYSRYFLSSHIKKSAFRRYASTSIVYL